MKTYTLQDILKLRGVNIPIKPVYSELEFLAQKHNLASKGGACMIYDRVPRDVGRWIDCRLRKYNMAWVQGRSGWAMIVQLDDSRPLPPNYFEIGERILSESDEYSASLVEKGRVSPNWFGGVTFAVKN
jgi:hypothetical protein